MKILFCLRVQYVAGCGGVAGFLIIQLEGLVKSPTNELLLAWDSAGCEIWSLKNDKRLARFTEYDTVGASISPSGAEFVTWDSDGTLNVWTLKKPEPVLTGTHDDAVLGVAWKQDSKELLSWSNDGTAKIWFLEKPGFQQILRHDKSVLGATFGHDGNTVLTWGEDDTAKLWKVGRIAPLNVFRSIHPLRGAAFHTDGFGIWTWAVDGSLELWDSGTVKRFKQESCISEFQMDKDGKHFLTWAADGRIRFWSMDHGEPICIISESQPVDGADISSSAKELLTWSQEGGARLWDLSVIDSPLKQQILEFEVRSATTLGPDGQVLDLSPDEFRLKQATFEHSRK